MFKYGLICLLLTAVLFFVRQEGSKRFPEYGNADGLSNNLKSRQEWELNRLMDPATGKIPANIASLELEFASTLPTDEYITTYRSAKWTHRGPYNFGGRTRAFAMDVSDSNILLAGGVSSGMWRSVDGGKNWIKVTLPGQLHNVSCLVQDKRPGKTNIWYYGTGEAYGNSAYASGAYYYGNGLFKSVDNGQTWTQLESTQSPNITDFDPWDLIWNVAVDVSNDSQDVVYAAALRRIFRSSDGGKSWTVVLGGDNGSYFTDVAVTTTGVVYATMSKDGKQAGIWRSDDGVKFTNILPLDTFPEEYNRIVIGIDPNNENVVYFLAHTPGYGKKSLRSQGEEDWNSLWKYRYLSGNGSGGGGKWENLTAQIPSDGGKNFDNFNAQGGYNLVVSVMPGDSNVVFISGTNIYRSKDGFRSDSMITQIGGYAVHTKRPKWEVFKNHHPDQHVLFFNPANPEILFNGNDGGVFKTYNCLADTVKWISLNNGYLTTQMYTVSIEENGVSDVIIAGLQDNGNIFVNSQLPNAEWVLPYNGDGSFSGIAKNRSYYIMSTQLGKIRKLRLDEKGNVIEFTRIDPVGGKNYLFINPLLLDPANDKLYLAEGLKLWRNDSLTALPWLNNYDSISTGWKRFTDTIKYPNRSISALAITVKNPANRLYVGTSKSLLYKVESAHEGDPLLERITTLSNAGNISCIAVDPRDGNKVMVVFSNYKVYSLFYSQNGGESWEKVAGNLEEKEDGSGNGPSLRWASILPLKNGKTLYFLATSVGLFATDTLLGLATRWINIGHNIIGNVVVDMVKTRSTDGLVVVATHGNGIYSTYVDQAEDLLGSPEDKFFQLDKVKVFPSLSEDKVTIAIRNPSDRNLVRIFDLNGKLVFSTLAEASPGKNLLLTVETADFRSGYYLVEVNAGNEQHVGSFIKR